MTAYLTHSGQPALDRCAACAKRLTNGYYFLRDRTDRYCPECIATRARCDACSAPVGDLHWTLHDGRVMCARCHATAVFDPAVARELYDQTVAGVAAQLGLRLHAGVEFRLVDAPTLTQIRASGTNSASAESAHPIDEKTLGLYQREGKLRAIYLLYGLPKLLFRTVVAHEYAHAWQGEACPLLDDDGLREGFAEWVAYRHLLYLGCTRAAQRMRTSSHPYRPLMEQVLDLEARTGPAGVIAYILQVGHGYSEVIHNP